MNIALTVRHLRLRLGLLLALLAGAVGPLLAQTPPNLNRVEFFLDTDPGHGLATAVALPGPAAPTRLGLTFPVPLGSLAPGFHRLFIRSRDANNQWSQTFSRLIFVDDNSALVAPNLAEVEHFLDTDPGFGNGSRTALTGTSALNRTIPVSLASLSPGFHRLFLRTRDASGKWSQTFGRLFFVDDVSAQVAPNLTRAEFYFDTDPGFGSGSAIATGAAATSYTALPVAADASALPDGPHRLFVRVLDANGRWSQVLNRAFVRSGCAASENLAENRPAASYGGNLGAAVAEAVFNGRGEANFFNTNTVQADLGVATRSVSEAQVSLRNPNGAAVSGTLTLEISLNGTTFTAAGSVPVALAASQAAPQRVALPLAAAVAGVRAVRLLLTLPSLTQAIRMTDAGVYFFNCVSPVITSFTPTSGPVGTGITITGTNLGGVTAVRFNGVVASVFSGVSATSVTATVPAGASTGPISLTTANGTAVSSSNFTVSTAAPTIASFAPATGPVGTSVTLTGTDLSTTTAVRFNGVNAPTFAVVNGTTVTATVPGGATTGVIGVTTAGGTGSSAASFVVLLPPTVASFAPASGPVGTSVTITGTSFSGATAVTFNGVSASGFVVNSATEITVAVPAGATTGVIGVTTPIGSGQSAGSFAVSVPPAPAPTIASFAPGSGPVGTSVVVTGTNLAGATALTFNGLTASFVVNSATQVTATVPTGATTGAIGVSTPNGTGSSAGNFTVTAPPVSAPTIASFAPTSGPVGTSVLLTGTDFSGATALTFNGLAATFVVNSATSITATVPTGATTGVIRVTTAGGSASSATSFTVTTAPPVPTIATTGFGGAFCAGASLSVAFTASGFASGNVFTAQLSDAGGLFAAPVSLGTLPGTGSGSIAATIPAGTAAGSGYRVRVVGSSPATVGTDNGSNLIISAFGLTAWTGAAGTTNWFDTGNWSCGQLPTAATDVTLPAGLSRYPVLPATGPVPTVRNLTLASGASLTLGNGFSISGNLTNNGTLNAGSSTFTLAGTAAQTLGGSGGTVLFDLTLNNPAGASLLAPLAVRRVLRLTAGNLASGGFLTLRSDASGTAMVVNSSGSSLVTGTATMERFINNASGAGYRHYASPMQAGTATVQQFADDLPGFELNPAYNTVGSSVSPFPTFFAYDETRLNALAVDNFDQGWRVPLATDALAPGRGYTAQTANATLVDISGTLAHADVSLSLTRGAFANSGWHLLGNPFPSPLDWDLVPAAPGVDRALYVFVPSGPYSGTYRSYLPSPVAGQPGIGQNGGTKDVAAMQGYFVRATANGSAFTLPAAARPGTYADPTFARGTATADTRPLLRLQVANAAGQTDETVIYFDPAAGSGFSSAHDAHQVQRNGNGFPSLWSEASGPAGALALSINGLPDVLRAPSIPLGVRVSSTGSHTLSAPALLNLPAGTEVWLEDQALGRRHNLSQVPSYVFTMAASFSGPRFVLWLQQRPLSTAPNAALQANLRLYPNPATSTATVELAGASGPVELTLVNVLGQVVERRTAMPRAGALREPLDLRALPTGVYLLHVRTAAGHATQRLLRE